MRPLRELALGIVIAVGACGDPDAPTFDEDREGGDATIDDRSSLAFTLPFPDLDPAQAETHLRGMGPFAFHWEAPQLGPLFNNDSCVGCHDNNGRGKPEIGPDVFGSQALIRISMPTGTPDDPGGDVPVPGFGLQLQDHSVIGVPEGNVTLTWEEIEDNFADGTVVMRRRPHITVVQPTGEPLPDGTLMSLREAPALVGIGLLEAISDDTLLALADPDDADGDGISGRVNLTWDDVAQVPRIGRFGRKASVPHADAQIAAAFVNDMGLTNKIFPDTDGMSRDVSDDQLAQTTFAVMTFGVPAAAPRDEIARHGRVLFGDFGCTSCHVPTQVTGPHAIPQLANQTIHPYTDLLLHDMGDDLADGRPDFAATGTEWRTPALWGLGLAQVVQPGVGYLHDGRARTLEEAILWHGGEAISRRERFRNASRADREALLAFLGTL